MLIEGKLAVKWISKVEKMGKKMVEKPESRVKGKSAESTLPFCTTAPSAEHARSHNEDEPCNDYRSDATADALADTKAKEW